MGGIGGLRDWDKVLRRGGIGVVVAREAVALSPTSGWYRGRRKPDAGSPVAPLNHKIYLQARTAAAGESGPHPAYRGWGESLALAWAASWLSHWSEDWRRRRRAGGGGGLARSPDFSLPRPASWRVQVQRGSHALWMKHGTKKICQWGGWRL